VPLPRPLVPGCDGAGVVVATGSSVSEFAPGDRVITLVADSGDGPGADDAPGTIALAAVALGQGNDGTLQSFGVFTEKTLIHAPRTLDWLPAATITCTWVTAWNVLYGKNVRHVNSDSWVLIQGTGGVSVAALQLAVGAGAKVVATTSSEERASRLKELGALHVINYRTSPDSWGREARELTPDNRGFDIVVDVAGNETLPQSLAAVRPEGTIDLVGGVGAATAEPVPAFAALFHSCTIRGLLAGTRNQAKELVRYIDEKEIKPVVDDVVFDLADVKDAYRRLKEKKHFAKIIIKIQHDE
jgi:NADPH:quinone reductase-like Zn-dependent oxidoreductase